jgi:hypothetical protein
VAGAAGGREIVGSGSGGSEIVGSGTIGVGVGAGVGLGVGDGELDGRGVEPDAETFIVTVVAADWPIPSVATYVKTSSPSKPASAV